MPSSALAAGTGDLPYRIQPAMTSSYGSAPQHLVASGSLIVWQDNRGKAPDIYGYDLDDLREFRVARTSGYRTQPAADGARVIWLSGERPERRTIEGVDLSQGRALTVLAEPGEVSDPVLSGDTAVWRQNLDGRWQIRLADLRSGAIATLPAPGDNQAYPAISGHVVVWQSYVNGSWQLVEYDLTAKTSRMITTGSDDDTRPALDGDHLIYLRQPGSGGAPKLVLKSLASGKEKVLSEDHLVALPAVSHGVVAWEDWRTGLPDIYAYDIAKDITFAVARTQQAGNPAVSERGVAWISRTAAQKGRVQAVAFIPRLPTDPQDPPAVPSADHQYVPETKHFMSSGFKAFWQSHGGPQLLGFPLSEEFSDKDSQSGEPVVVQYFQRVELQYRPSAPEGQQISLARLGAELTAGRQFPAVDPFESTGTRVYFPETGHSLALGFKEFWDANGGLAMFGFPISEEIQEGGRTVQYFERARFEFNPNSGDPNFTVTLGLLGQEALQRKGYLSPPPIDTTLLAP